MTAFLFGSTPIMEELDRWVRSIAGSGLPLLIEGESSTGKDRLAEHIHRVSQRGGEFVRFHCGAPDAEALGVRLLGRTGAAEGTLLLKHVARLSQRVCSSGCWAPCPGAAFESFVPRLNPWRRRRSRGLLARSVCSPVHLPAVCTAAAGAVPGSGRTLLGHGRRDILRRPNRNCSTVTRAIAVLKRLLLAGQSERAAGFRPRLFPDGDQVIRELRHRSRTLPVERADPAGGGLSLRDQVRQASRQFESEIILKALERHRWNRRRTAKTLQISYRALLYKIKNCNLRAEAL